ncbi:MAG TPA: ATP-binding protein [Anaerolineaceae bacterium]|nr:ATP-binding protein [Anaerolineaceae bacterium]
MKFSLQQKMILAFSVVVIVSIGGVVIFANLDSQRQVNRYLTRGGQYGVMELVEALEDYYEYKGTWSMVGEVADAYSQRHGRKNAHGKASELTLTDQNHFIVWSNAGQVKGEKLTGEMTSRSLEIHSGGQTVGYLVVENGVLQTPDDIAPFVNRLRRAIFLAGGFAILLAIGLAVLVSKYLLEPIKVITSASTQLSTGDFSTRVDIKGNDEIAMLAKTFNQLARNLELAEERKQSLTADAAHELRTPIAVQKAQLEGMLDGVLPLTQKNVLIALQQTNFLSRLVEDLRLLAMADAGEVRLEMRILNIVNLVQQVVAGFQAQAALEGTNLVTVFRPDGEELWIHTDVDRVSQILQNLISNALRYGQKGGRILISTRKESAKLVISVQDDGSGIPSTALPHLFERFYRHERARTRENGGSGLGLAISKKLALLLGGDLSGANSPEGGAVFSLELPIRNT